MHISFHFNTVIMLNRSEMLTFYLGGKHTAGNANVRVLMCHGSR